VSQPLRGLWHFRAAGVGGEPVADEAQHLGELGGAGGAEGHVLYGVANTLLIRAALALGWPGADPAALTDLQASCPGPGPHGAATVR
jgi:hypothetical protein